MADLNPECNPMSYSLIIDEMGSQINTNHTISSTLPINEIKSVQKRKIYSWVRDDAVTNCYECKEMFTYYNRKHHCRVCGRIFCNTCCNKYIDVSESDASIFPSEPDKTIMGEWIEQMQIQSYIPESIMQQETGIRTCTDCYNTMKESKIVSESFSKLEKECDITQIHDIAKNENSGDYRASIFYLSKFREIQYKLIFKQFSETEENLMESNKHLFIGHSQWIYQLIMSLRSDNSSNMPYIVNLLKKNSRTVECKILMCSSQCKPKLNSFQVCNVLYHIKNLSNDLVTILIPILDSISDENLDSYLMMFTNRLIEENTESKKPLTSYIFERAKNSVKLADSFIVCLNTMKMSDDRQRGIILEKVKQEFIKYLISYQSVFIEVMKIDGFIQLFKKDFVTIQHIKNKIIPYVTASSPIVLPFKMDYVYHNIDINNITTKASKCMPIEIPFGRTCDEILDEEKIDKKDADEKLSAEVTLDEIKLDSPELVYDSILFKQEDLRQDYVICKIIKLMTQIIKTELGIDIELVSYDVVPLDTRKGLIEVISDSETINSISEKKFTIQNYIMEHNKDITANDIRDVFCKSTAAYCIITYLLGIEDRHLDNIMIHKSGRLFHVDFGYILGCNQKIINSDIRITPDMLDAMGGLNSTNYNEFCNLCTSMYNAIRKHAFFFSCILLQLNKINSSVYTLERIEAEVTKKFEPGISQSDGKNHLSNLIIKNQSDYWKYSLVDMFHSVIKSMKFS